MNILINILDVTRNYGGVYQYSYALIQILAKARLSHNFYVLCKNPDEELLQVIERNENFSQAILTKPQYSRVQRWVHKLLNKSKKIFSSIETVELPDEYDILIKKYNIDIIHFPYQRYIDKPGIKSITTLHDVQELYFPQFFTSEERAFRAVHYKAALEKSDVVVVSYKHIKLDLIKFFQIPEEKIHVVLLDMQDLWFQDLKLTDEKYLDSYDIPQDFLLYPAATWEHKNHLGLLKALKLIEHKQINIVFTGHLTEHYRKSILPYIKKTGLIEQVKFVGLVSKECLYELYSHSRGVVIPTLYEAGSFPLMESILMGIPVICSNITSLPETIGHEDFIFDPKNLQDMGEKLQKIWSDEDFRKRNIQNSKIQSHRLQFNNAGQKFHDIYKNI